MFSDGLRLACEWTVWERPPGGLWRPVLRRRNLFTDAGLTAYASAIGGSQASNYVAPEWLAIDTNVGAIQNAGGLAVGATSVTLDADPTLAGDTRLILGVGSANQETVTFSAKSGTGPYTFTIAATAKSHARGDLCVRPPTGADTVANAMTREAQYDAALAPGKRMQSVGGYSQGTGNWTVQFFFTGAQALVTFGRVGLCDSDTLGAGTLHNEIALGYVHTSGNDVEVDVSLTLANG